MTVDESLLLSMRVMAEIFMLRMAREPAAQRLPVCEKSNVST